MDLEKFFSTTLWKLFFATLYILSVSVSTFVNVTLLEKFLVNLFLFFSGAVQVKQFVCSVIRMQSPVPRGSSEKVRRRRKLLLDMCPMWWLSGKNILLWIFNFWTKYNVQTRLDTNILIGFFSILNFRTNCGLLRS